MAVEDNESHRAAASNGERVKWGFALVLSVTRRTVPVLIHVFYLFRVRLQLFFFFFQEDIKHYSKWKNSGLKIEALQRSHLAPDLHVIEDLQRRVWTCAELA